MAEPPVIQREERFHWKRYVLGVAILVLAIFVVQNSQSVVVDFLFTETETPLVFALLFAAAIGALIGWATPRVLRSERDRRD